nr:MAG TPA: ribosome, girodazole, girolline, antibiotic complex, 50S [Caudoviricetes sp.]
MTAPASTKYKVSKKVVKRYLADHDLTQKQLAQMAGITPGALSALIRFQRDMRVGNYSPFAALYTVFCGVRRFPRYKDILHLADLIDRPTTTRHGKFKTKYGRETPCCEVCGYSIGDMRWNHCPKCGAAIDDAEH